MKEVKVKYTIKVRDEHNPPKFHKKFKKGVLVTVDATFKFKDNETEYITVGAIHEYSQKLLDEYIEVVTERDNKK